MLRVGAECRDILVTNNLFNAKGLAFAVEAGAAGVTASNNRYMNPHVRVPEGYK